MVVAENEVNAVLKCLLEAEKATVNIDELRLLIEGQFAAPANIEPDSWMSLVVPDPSDDLREALRSPIPSGWSGLPVRVDVHPNHRNSGRAVPRANRASGEP